MHEENIERNVNMNDVQDTTAELDRFSMHTNKVV